MDGKNLIKDSCEIRRPLALVRKPSLKFLDLPLWVVEVSVIGTALYC